MIQGLLICASSLLCCRTFPIRGFQIYDGPVQLTRSTFRGFVPTPERYTSAVGFSLKNTWQLTPRNNLSRLSFHPSVSRRRVRRARLAAREAVAVLFIAPLRPVERDGSGRCSFTHNRLTHKRNSDKVLS